MLAFLKRRWILLSCAAVLMACSYIDASYRSDIHFPSRYHPSFGLVYFDSVSVRQIAVMRGQVILFEDSALQRAKEQKSESFARWHFPQFGKGVTWDFRSTIISLAIPLWLPLSAILGWIVIRELRFREKPAKAVEVPPA